MPELPEVETIRRQMEKELVGQKIIGLEINFDKRLKPSAAAFKKRIVGAKFKSFGRRAKLLLLNLSNNLTVVTHLKMTGQYLLRHAADPADKHVHLKFKFVGGNQLWFRDVRKFGYLKLVPTADLEAAIFAREGYGPEPLDPDFTLEKFVACFKKRSGKKLKAALLDQTCVVGIGNIYADETCWLAKVRPGRKVGSLSVANFKSLYLGARKVLTDSIGYGGASADDYLNLYGDEGQTVPHLKVYGRDGSACRRCGGVIKKIRLAGRGTHFCPKCQK